MRVDNQIMMSQTYSKDYYLSLKLNCINENDFKEAIKIFEDRINGWYLDQIKLMLDDAKKNAFVIMALDCILIETFWHFRNGNRVEKDKYIFCEFLSEVFPSIFSMSVAKDFYSNIRCALLHSGQTDKEFVLSVDGNSIDIDNNVVIINVVKISKLLIEYFEKYIEELNNEDNNILRRNFIIQMDATMENIKNY